MLADGISLLNPENLARRKNLEKRTLLPLQLQRSRDFLLQTVISDKVVNWDNH